MYKDNTTKTLLGMLNSIDDLAIIADGQKWGEIRAGDLAFVDTTDFDGDGFIYWVKRKEDAGTTYFRVYRTQDTITLCCPTDGDVYSTHPIEDVEIKGKVTGVYRKLPAVATTDFGEYAYMFDAIRKAKPGSYDIKWSEILAITAKYAGRTLDCICAAFVYGYVKGQRCEKARRKKEAVTV